MHETLRRLECARLQVLSEAQIREIIHARPTQLERMDYVLLVLDTVLRHLNDERRLSEHIFRQRTRHELYAEQDTRIFLTVTRQESTMHRQVLVVLLAAAKHQKCNIATRKCDRATSTDIALGLGASVASRVARQGADETIGDKPTTAI
jgi:hypothetical protein